MWSFLLLALLPAASVGVFGVVAASTTRTQQRLDRLGGRVGTATVVHAGLLASAMVALGFISSQFTSDARACMFERLQFDGEFAWTSAASLATIFVYASGLAFCFAHSLCPQQPGPLRRWLTYCVIRSTFAGLALFPLFVYWMLNAADC